MFLHPLGLLALLAVPAVVFLHWLRRRFRVRRVSALFLWTDDVPVPASGPRLERFHASPSFWLEVLAATSLAIAFGGPRACADARAEHLVCVLDHSASMGASGPDGSVDERVREWLASRLRGLSGSSRVTLVRSGTPPRIFCGPAALPREALEALPSWTPEAVGHEPDAALSLALEAAGGERVVYLTDHAPERELPAEVELVSFGHPLENLAILRALRERSRDGSAAERVLVTLGSFADRARDAVLELSAGTRTLERRSVPLSPGEEVSVAFELPAGTGELELSLAPDALAIDGRAYLAPLATRPIALGTTLSAEECELLGLAVGSSPIGRWLALVDDAVPAVDVEHADLVLARALVGGERAWCLTIEGFEAARSEIHLGPFLVERRHPLLEGASFQGVLWAAASDVSLTDTPLISSENGALLTERITGARRVFRMNLDPGRSSLQRSSDWPILLANLAELRARELDGPGRTNVLVGEALVLRGVPRGTMVLRSAARGAARELEADGWIAIEAESPGFWSLERDGRELARYGVTFSDAGESDLRRRSSTGRPARASAARLDGASSPLESLGIALALVALLADAWVLARGRGAPARRA